MFKDLVHKILYKNQMITISTDDHSEYFIRIGEEFIGSFKDPVLAMETAYSVVDCEIELAS